MPATFSFEAAVLGTLIACGAAYLLALLSSSIEQWIEIGRGAKLDDLYTALTTSALYNGIAHLTNIAAAALGGYWAARLGSARPLLHAGVAGAMMLLPIVIAFAAPYPMPYPKWSLILFFITPVPSAMIGGRRALRDAARAHPVPGR
jgi:hypothetical protein